MLNDSLLVHNKRCALSPIILHALAGILVKGLQNAVAGQNLAIHITQQRKSDADLFCKRCVRSGTVNADAENNCVIRFELGQISLIGLEFLSSTTGESENIEGQHYIFLSPIVAQFHRFPLVT